MGDRANIVIQDGEDEVWLYTHWDGYRYEDALRDALAKRWRWDDAPYLARIIFEELIKGNEGTETGFGISTRMCDNEHPILVVDTDSQEVRLENADGRAVTRRQSFEDFVGTTVPSES